MSLKWPHYTLPDHARFSRRRWLPPILLPFVVVLITLTSCTDLPAPQSLPNPTPVPVASAFARVAGTTPTQTPPVNDYQYAIIGNAQRDPAALYAAGLRIWIVRLSWRDFAPTGAGRDEQYIAAKQQEFARLRGAGFQLILDPGFHDTPAWIHERYPGSRYIDQDGVPYSGGDRIDSGDANLIFNPVLRTIVDAYLADIFATFGTEFAAVRAGGGRHNELMYPPSTRDHARYWAFDRYALAASPAPGWRPGAASPHGEAAQFMAWYLDALVDYQNWQIQTLRRSYRGPIMILYPGWGIRPGQLDEAIRTNLDGTTTAEKTGEVPMGTDYARQIAALRDPDILVTTTWLDATEGSDNSPEMRYWRPVKYLASLVAEQAYCPRLYGENTGQGTATALRFAIAQMAKFRLLGLAWYREEELSQDGFAGLDDLRTTFRILRDQSPR